jgi:nucleoid-associated protein YgaU
VLEAPLQVRQPEPVEQIIQPPPVITAPVTVPPPRQVTPANRRTAPVWSFNVPSVIPREGVNYTIRPGDTLWDISEAFYRDPWLYPRIAQHNNIRNPNLIISGRIIRIPPRN